MSVPSSLSPMFVLNREEDECRNRVLELELFYQGDQYKYLTFDWFGDVVYSQRGGYVTLRKGYANKLARGSDSGASTIARKPCVEAALAAQTAATLTDFALESPPSVEVLADDDTTAALAEALKQAKYHAKLYKLRHLGAVGASVAIVEIVEGRPTIKVLKATDVLVLEWASQEEWIPADVVFQRTECLREIDDRGNVTEVEYILTTRWTETRIVEYEPVDTSKEREDTEPLTVASEKPHRSGRCPVVWYRNLSGGDEYGTHDLETDAALKICDAADRTLSHISTAVIANTQPTVWKADTMVAGAIFGQVRKGSGNMIQLSEAGKVGYLEINGSSITAAWETFDRMIDRLEAIAHVVLAQKESVGHKTATEVVKDWSGMDAKVRRIQGCVSDAFSQVCEVLLTLLRAWGVSGVKGSGKVYLPQMVEVVEDDVEDDDLEDGVVKKPRAQEPRKRLKDHKLGSGETVTVSWTKSRTVTPKDLPSVLTGLSLASKSQVLSHETAVGEAMSALGRDDQVEEIARIKEESAERAARAPSFDLAKAEDDAEDTATGPVDGEEEELADDEGRPPQKE